MAGTIQEAAALAVKGMPDRDAAPFPLGVSLMSDAILGFRTITRAWLERLVLAGDPPVLTPKPIGLFLPPESADINPGISQQEINTKTMQGETTTALTYIEQTRPELMLDFGVASPEVESLIHGRVAATKTGQQGFVFFEVDPSGTTVTGRTTGQYGGAITAQDPTTSTAQVYYNDPVTKLAKPVTLVDAAATPAGDQIKIGAGLEITLSPELVEAGNILYGMVPTTYSGTGMTSEVIGLIGVRLLGIHFDGTVKLFTARYCSLLFGSSIGAEPKRQVKLRILPDANDGTGLGWSTLAISERMV